MNTHSRPSTQPMTLSKFLEYLERDLHWLQGAGEAADHQWLRTRVGMKKNLKGLKLELGIFQPSQETD